MSIRFETKTVRAAAILTNSYVAGTVLENCHKFDELQVLAKFTKGSLTDAQIKVEFSNDGSTYYQQAFGSVTTTTNTLSLGVHKIAADGNYVISVPLRAKYVKISAIGTGTATNSSLEINAVLTAIE